MAKPRDYLQLIRPANVLTAVGDILAGAAIAGWAGSTLVYWPLILLCFSSALLYAGGIVFNDIFDLAVDRIERPERVIPSGRISKNSAIALGIFCLATGVLLAFVVNIIAGVIACLVAVCAMLYDRFGKRHPWFGPVNMGMCRSLNLLLGMAVASALPGQWYLYAWVPLVYIFAITLISRGEVHGGRSNTIIASGVLYLTVIVFQFFIAARQHQLLPVSVALLLFAFMIFPPLIRAIRTPSGKNIGKSVKAGVIGLIAMDAAWAASFGAYIIALVIFILLPISAFLGKRFAVT